MKKDFEELFTHFDPNDTGFVEVEQMRRFIQSLVHDN